MIPGILAAVCVMFLMLGWAFCARSERRERIAFLACAAAAGLLAVGVWWHT